MFQRVMVAVDGRAGGDDAIALARFLSTPRTELSLAHVFHGDPAPWPGAHADWDAGDRGRARELLDAARSRAGVSAELRWTGASSVGRGLHELAERHQIELLVVGSSRRGILGRVLLGDHTQAALAGAPCAIAIAPAGFAGETAIMREIGVGYDGSAESESALAAGRRLAAEHRCRLSAFEAVFFPARLYAAPPWPDAATLEEIVGEALSRVSKLEGVEPHAAYGEPADELTFYSASLDLLVIGSRSYGPVGRLMHGSTAQRLARSAHCPLLILPRGAATGEAPVARETSAAGRRPEPRLRTHSAAPSARAAGGQAALRARL